MTSDVEAYNLYMQGNALIQRLSPENLSRATELCRQAVTRDPKFARGYDCIANAQMSYVLLAQQSYEHFAAAEEAARQALALDPKSTAARVATSSLAGFRGQWADAETRNRATVALIPNDALVHMVYSYHLYHVGRTRDALREVQLAYTLAPASPLMVASFANNLWIAGDFAQAERYANLAQELGVSLRSSLLRWARIEATLQRRSYVEASALVDASIDRSDPDWSRTAELHKLAYAVLADEIDAAYDLIDQCLAMLKPPYAEPGDALSRFWSPLMRRFRENTRFQALATRVGWMDYWLQYGFPDDCEYKNNKLTCH
jgi:Tfp pilus assembly protein PilF